jgi:hypothetical protein
MSGNTFLKYMYRFCRVVIAVFEKLYLGEPAVDDTSRLLSVTRQEACRKDIEQTFGVLQSRWVIVRHPARTWSLKTIYEVMTFCVIIHNMIGET